MQKLTAHEHPLRKIFSSDFEFKIPEYQRPYRWGTDQALQLLDDLEETLDRGADEPYFLGSLVLVKQDDACYDVIDGQQRLTTLTLLFSVLRDLVEGDEFARNLSERVLDPGNELDGIPSRPRLTLREQDAPFFRKYVQEPGHINTLVDLTDAAAATEPQRALRDNAAAFWARLSDWSDHRRRALATLASTRTYLVVVSTPSLDSAYRIFSVMNARGLDLTPADIFKSRVIGQVADRSDYSKRWEVAEEALGSVAFTELVALAYTERVQLWSDGFYATPGLSWDRDTMQGRPFFYFAYGAAVSEVVVDTLTGEWKLLRADILHDAGQSLNPALDIGQVEGAFIQGMGWLTTEELVWHPQSGKLTTHAPSTYKIPTANDCPPVFNVRLFEGRNVEDSIHRSKAVGEPPLLLPFSVFYAIRDAISAVSGHRVSPPLRAPATSEAILQAITAVRAEAGG